MVYGATGDLTRIAQIFGLDNYSCFVCSFFQSNLSGFYDPCPEEEKMLRIRYLFREAMHEVTVGDEEPVKIPKQCKYCFLTLCCGYTSKETENKQLKRRRREYERNW